MFTDTVSHDNTKKLQQQGHPIDDRLTLSKKEMAANFWDLVNKVGDAQSSRLALELLKP